MTHKEKLVMAEALGALRNIAETTDGYVAQAIAHAAIWGMGRIVETGRPPGDEESKEFLRSQGFHPAGVTQPRDN